MAAARAPVSGANFAAGAQTGHRPVGREWRGRARTADPRRARSLSPGHRHLRHSMAIRNCACLARGVVAQFEAFDVYLSPVMTAPPPPIGYLVGRFGRSGRVRPPPDRPVSHAGAVQHHRPALDVGARSPCRRGGLPIGAMFSGRYADEATLFTLAGQLEREFPWTGRSPPAGENDRKRGGSNMAAREDDDADRRPSAPREAPARPFAPDPMSALLNVAGELLGEVRFERDIDQHDLRPGGHGPGRALSLFRG